MRNVTVAVMILFCALAGVAVAQSTVDLAGTATAVDGDDIVLATAAGMQRVRLCGIDAPARHTGARAAKAYLAALIDGADVRCVVVGKGTPCDGRSKPRNGRRIVAQCFVGEIDIAEAMVRSGHACDWAKFSGGHYARAVAGGQLC